MTQAHAFARGEGPDDAKKFVDQNESPGCSRNVAYTLALAAGLRSAQPPGGRVFALELTVCTGACDREQLS